MKVIVYGAGAVGLGLASCLVKSGVAVSIVSRPETTALLNSAGLLRSGIFGDHTALPRSFSAVSRIEELAGDDFDFVLVCVKSYDSAAAAGELSRAGIVQGPARIVLCQNGWGNAQAFAAHFPEDRIFCARIITGFTRPSPNHVKITVHADAIHMGSLFGRPPDSLEPLCAAIAGGGIPCIPFPQIGRDLWAKMLYNCALNPLGAIFKVTYGTLAAHGETRAVMDAVIREIFKVMTAHGHTTHWSTPDDYLEAFYTRLVPPTAGHESSMLQDIRAGKKTEIGALNGQVVRLAMGKGMESPLNAAITNMIGFLERQTPILS